MSDGVKPEVKPEVKPVEYWQKRARAFQQLVLDGLDRSERLKVHCKTLGDDDDQSYFRYVIWPTGVIVGHYGYPLEGTEELCQKVKNLPKADWSEHGARYQKARDDWFEDCIKRADNGEVPSTFEEYHAETDEKEGNLPCGRVKRRKVDDV